MIPIVSKSLKLDAKALYLKSPNFYALHKIFTKKRCYYLNLDNNNAVIIWRRLTLPRMTAVPSAQRGLTTLFGMGKGEHPR